MKVRGYGYHVKASQILRRRPASQLELEGRLLRRKLPSSSSVEMPIFPAEGNQLIHPKPYLECLEEIISALPQRDAVAKALVRKAFYLAWEGHGGVIRQGEKIPYILHPLRIAKNLVQVGLGAEEVAAALCHDLVEDSCIGGVKITSEFLRSQLGDRVADIVEGLTELGKEPEFKGKKPSLVDIFAKWFEYGSKDLAIIIIKLYDRLDNMRTLEGMPQDKRMEKAHETLYVHARIADRLGMWELKRELEDLAFQYLEPRRYEQIKIERAEIVASSRERVEEVRQKMLGKLALNGIKAEIIIEQRAIYELDYRMRKKKLDRFLEGDIWRFSVVVPQGSDCYQALRLVHGLYPPDQSHIRDYISEPRPNGHQFLRTHLRRVFTHGTLLVHIRTQEMHKGYQYGVLAKREKKDVGWLISLLEDLRREEGVGVDRLYRMVADKADPIVVYSERGDPWELPLGATPLDFARAVHKDIFLHAAYARVNGRRASLFESLRPDDAVFVVTDPSMRPSLEWLDHLHTPEAVQALRSYLKERPQEVIVEAGRSALEKESGGYFLPVEDLINTVLFKKYCVRLGLDARSLLEEIGRGRQRAKEVLSHLREMYMAWYKKGLKQRHSRVGPYYLSIRTRDRKGLIETLSHSVREMGFNVHDVFPVYPEGEEGMVNLVLAVDILWGRWNVGIVSQIQCLQARTIAAQVLSPEEKQAGNLRELSREEVLALLEEKRRKLESG